MASIVETLVEALGVQPLDTSLRWSLRTPALRASVGASHAFAFGLIGLAPLPHWAAVALSAALIASLGRTVWRLKRPPRPQTYRFDPTTSILTAVDDSQCPVAASDYLIRGYRCWGFGLPVALTLSATPLSPLHKAPIGRQAAWVGLIRHRLPCVLVFRRADMCRDRFRRLWVTLRLTPNAA